jgi:hypothetical protein
MPCPETSQGHIRQALLFALQTQTNLLGLNVGGGGGHTREVKVRLRPARDPESFLPYESVLHTMLHELVHNVRGPHDK